MENFERKQEKFDGKFQKKEWDIKKISKKKMGHGMQSFKKVQKIGIFDGKFQKKECNIRWKVSKEGIGHLMERKEGDIQWKASKKYWTFDGKYLKKEWDIRRKVSKDRMEL